MATLREYFDQPVGGISEHVEWGMQTAEGRPVPPVVAKIVRNLEANSKHWSFYIPAGDVGAYVNGILSSAHTERCSLDDGEDTVVMLAGFSEYSEKTSSATLVFTRRIFFYIDAPLTLADRNEINARGAACGFHVVVRDQEYATKRSELEKPLAFISHDSRDKDSLVRELALELSKLLCPVWYDEYSLKVGDSLRTSIEKGLKETRKCIVVLSPNFLSNDGWGKAEFDSVYIREILEKNNVMLPVWHGVGVREVYDYSPRLADKVGLNSAIGVKTLAQRLSAALKQSQP
jgi:hypothetical protein